MKTTTQCRPIIFSGEMVRAILEGRKTQTRRIIKNINPTLLASDPSPEHIANSLTCPFGRAGDSLWVRESFSIESFGADVAQIRYKADNARGPSAGVSDRKLPNRLGGVPSIHMPRQCSRITLTVTDVRVERLQDISEEDAIAEGIAKDCSHPSRDPGYGCSDCQNTGFATDPRLLFAELWESIHSAGSWDQNPWLWVVGWPRVPAYKNTR